MPKHGVGRVSEQITSRMIIWIANHYVGLPNSVGSTRHFSLAQELIRLGHTVCLLTSDEFVMTDTPYLQEGAHYGFYIQDGIYILCIKTPRYRSVAQRFWNMMLFGWRLWRGIGFDNLPKPDVVLGSSVHLFVPWAMYRHARRHQTPFVVEIRDIWPLTLREIGQLSAYHPIILLFQYIESFVYRRADHIFTLLPLSHDYFVSRGVNKEQITWIPNGIDFSLLPEYTPPPQSRDPKRPFILIYAGAHGLANALSDTIRAVEILESRGYADRLHVRFIGEGRHKRKLQHQARDLHCISFEDAVPKSIIYQVMADADAFIINWHDSPLYQWGVSANKLFDYLAMGRPVIESSTSPYSVVRAAQAGIVVPAEDSIAIADAIETLMQMPIAQREQLGQNGRRYVKNEHDMQDIAKKVDALLRSLV